MRVYRPSRSPGGARRGILDRGWWSRFYLSLPAIRASLRVVVLVGALAYTSRLHRLAAEAAVLFLAKEPYPLRRRRRLVVADFVGQRIWMPLSPSTAEKTIVAVWRDVRTLRVALAKVALPCVLPFLGKVHRSTPMFSGAGFQCVYKCGKEFRYQPDTTSHRCRR